MQREVPREELAVERARERVLVRGERARDLLAQVRVRRGPAAVADAAPDAVVDEDDIRAVEREDESEGRRERQDESWYRRGDGPYGQACLT